MKKFFVIAIVHLILALVVCACASASAESVIPYTESDNYNYVACACDEEGNVFTAIVNIEELEEMCGDNMVCSAYCIYRDGLVEITWNWDIREDAFAFITFQTHYDEFWCEDVEIEYCLI